MIQRRGMLKKSPARRLKWKKKAQRVDKTWKTQVQLKENPVARQQRSLLLMLMVQKLTQSRRLSCRLKRRKIRMGKMCLLKVKLNTRKRRKHPVRSRLIVVARRKRRWRRKKAQRTNKKIWNLLMEMPAANLLRRKWRRNKSKDLEAARVIILKRLWLRTNKMWRKLRILPRRPQVPRGKKL